MQGPNFEVFLSYEISICMFTKSCQYSITIKAQKGFDNHLQSYMDSIYRKDPVCKKQVLTCPDGV